MNPQTLAAIQAHALADYPREACGLIVAQRHKEAYIECSNVAETPLEHFIIPAHEYAAAEDSGTVVAVVHSHPDGALRASEGDLVACEESGLPWHIVRVYRDLLNAGALVIDGPITIEPSGYEAPLIGRSFVHGVLDCYTLVQDWFKRERGIILPDFERRDKWWDHGQDLYMQQFEQAGFQRISAASEPGDCFLMQIRSPVANHAAVYLGDGKMLHHMYGMLSTVAIYGGMWQEMTRAVVRYVGPKGIES